ncbi:hypothetical protein BKA70DRAFT_1225189 [Coprinopsis sp. MPI-PUGE-AT-0042]|nr:hypothetical protein BKA70DRAFT_1225189 [Coprinopsis sp. MPI-PUGE-AT-0042]
MYPPKNTLTIEQGYEPTFIMPMEETRDEAAPQLPFHPRDATHLNISGGNWNHVEGSSYTHITYNIYGAQPTQAARLRLFTERCDKPRIVDSDSSAQRGLASGARAFRSASNPESPPSAEFQRHGL